MLKLFSFACLTVASLAAHAAALTDLEIKWLTAGKPVLDFARQTQLPLDIIVQPQDAPGRVPLAMGFKDGRCKLVLSMRGNPQAEDTLSGVPEAEQGVLIEAMIAHELGHCWRYVRGVWHALPAGFVEVNDEQGSAELLAASREMRETRREEGFADLVALAWTQQRSPQHYGQVFAWMQRMRANPPVERSHHDTRAWVALAADGGVFGQAGTPFEAAREPWNRGLLSDE